MLRSLRSRLIASYVFLIAICLTIVGVILGVSLLQRAAYARLRAAVVPTALFVRNLQQRGLPPQEIVRRMDEQAQAQGLDILIISRQGEVLAATGESWRGQRVSLRKIVTSREGEIVEGRITSPWGTRLYFVAWPMKGMAGEGGNSPPILVALVTTPWRGMRAVIGDLTVGFVVASVLAAVISLLLAVLIARSISRPLQRVTAATEEIARGNYDLTLNIASPDEVRRLAASFNSMARQVKASRQAQRDFVANVSHELRTPLATILTHLEVLLLPDISKEIGRQSLRLLKAEAQRMARLVNDMLELGRLETTVELERRPVDLLTVVEEAMAQIAPQAEEREIAISLEADAPLPLILGNADRLKQVFLNLLDNAVRYSRPGDRVVVSLRRVREGIACTVSDTGPGIPAEHLPYVTRRFYRAVPEGEGGSGLGLALVKEILRLHQSKLSIESQTEGEETGTCVRFVLPALREEEGEQ